MCLMLFWMWFFVSGEQSGKHVGNEANSIYTKTVRHMKEKAHTAQLRVILRVFPSARATHSPRECRHCAETSLHGENRDTEEGVRPDSEFSPIQHLPLARHARRPDKSESPVSAGELILVPGMFSYVSNMQPFTGHSLLLPFRALCQRPIWLTTHATLCFVLAGHGIIPSTKDRLADEDRKTIGVRAEGDRARDVSDTLRSEKKPGQTLCPRGDASHLPSQNEQMRSSMMHRRENLRL